MALTAAVAVAVAALSACVAAGGYAVGPWRVVPVAYLAALLPWVLAVAAGRRPRGLTVAPGVARWGRIALLFVGLYLFSGRGRPAAGTGLVTLLGLSVTGLGALWPRPAALRLCLAFSVVSLLAPAPSPGARPAALVAMGVASAVALVASARLSEGATPPLGGPPASPGPARTGGRMAGAGAVLAAAAVASLLMDTSSQSEAGGRPQSGVPAEVEDPAPLGFQEALDPAAAGRSRSGRSGDQVVLRVGADRADVWRAQTFDHWDGHRWVQPGEPGEASRGPLVWVGLDRFERSPSEQLVQRVRVEASYAAVAPGAPKAYFFELPGPAVVTAGGAVLPVPALGRGASYETTSGRSPASPATLRAAPPAGGALPDAPALTDRSRAFARRVTAGAVTAYDRMAALERALSTVEVDDEVAPLPPSADVVDTVLFGRGTASPERLATTLALLGRTVGVPTRLAAGFLPGRRPLLGGDFVVRARDAHVWVEVPFTGLGWQRFDATGRIAAAHRDDSLWSRLRRFLSRWWFVLAGLAAIALALLVRWLVRRRRRRRAVPWATRYLARLSRLGARRGRPRRPAETPAEYAAALASGVLADERLHDAGRLVTEAAWSGREVPEASRSWAEDVLRDVAATGRRRRR